MNVDVLLSRLERVKPSGPSSWRCECPVGHTSHGTLTVGDAGDGRLLVHCFAGCEVGDILALIGLRLSDLFPEPVRNTRGLSARDRAKWMRENAWDAAVAVAAMEVQVIESAANHMARGRRPSRASLARIRESSQRMQAIRDCFSAPESRAAAVCRAIARRLRTAA